MAERDRDYSDSDQYRRGVVLGFTVAEVIILILFALLLALAGLLLNNRKDVQRANAINERFDGVISSLNLGNSSVILKKINDALDENIDYQRKIKEIENKLRVQSLPDDVYAEIRAQKLDLSTKEGKQKFLDILTSALAAQKEIAKKSGDITKHVESACRAGFQMSEVLGKDKKPGEIINAVKDSKARSEYWQSQAARCGLAGVLPPCYRESNNEPVPYLYDARIKSDGIVLVNTVPEKYRSRFNADFPNLPQENTTLSLSNFSSSTSQFLAYGEKNNCRFYVVAYDDTLAYEKEKLKQLLKAIEGNFYKRTTW